VVPKGYNAGGAGYVLSRRAVTLLARRPRGLCRQDGGHEDVELGLCLERLGVRVGDTADSLGRSRFHWNPPEVHIHGDYPPPYRHWDKYGARKVSDINLVLADLER
jgi:glycoprotein-N-acetylgalactosamine 3-beta-galactosyltransferase